MRNLAGVGIDMVSINRMRRFLKSNRHSALERLCTVAEKKQLRRKRFSAFEFSKLFAAKEAFFKATGGSWMGLEGFRALEVKPLWGGRFQVRRKEKRKSMPPAEGHFFRDKEWVGAQVILWR